MKRFLIALVVLVTAIGLAAPVSAKEKAKKGTRFGYAGKMVLSGDLGISNTKMEYDGGSELTTLKLNIAPEFGYFVIDNLLILGSIGYTSTSVDNGTTDTSSTGFDVMAGGRYYFNIGGSAFAYVGAGLGYAQVDPDEDTSTSGLVIDGGGGVALVFGKNFGGFVSLGLGVKYWSLTTEAGNAEADGSMLDLYLQSGLGVFF